MPMIVGGIAISTPTTLTIMPIKVPISKEEPPEAACGWKLELFCPNIYTLLPSLDAIVISEEFAHVPTVDRSEPKP